MSFRLGPVLFSLIVAFALVGCDSSTAPSATSPDALSSAIPSAALYDDPPRTIDDVFFEIATEIEGFGGAFFDEEAALVIHLTHPDDASLDDVVSMLEDRFGDLDALVADPRREIEGVTDVRLQAADFSYVELVEWYRYTWALAEIDGIHTTDIDERANRIRIAGIDEPTVLEAADWLQSAGVPEEAVVFEIRPRVEFVSTLRDRQRPVVGGLEIQFTGDDEEDYACTLGFIARPTSGGVPGFVTNSHCSAGFFESRLTHYDQPAPSSAFFPQTWIGNERVDPALRTDNLGNLYRWSDALYATLAPKDTGTVPHKLGHLAAPTSWSLLTGDGPLTIDATQPYVEIDRELSGFMIGSALDKIGRTTGWTAGSVEATCQRTFPDPGGGFSLRCQDEVFAKVNGGDSGSPVFMFRGDPDGDGSYNAELAGTLWGRRVWRGDTTFVFSRMSYVEMDLGLLTTH